MASEKYLKNYDYVDNPKLRVYKGIKSDIIVEEVHVSLLYIKFSQIYF